MKGVMMGDLWTIVVQFAELKRHYKIVKIHKVYGYNDELHNKKKSQCKLQEQINHHQKKKEKHFLAFGSNQDSKSK